MKKNLLRLVILLLGSTLMSQILTVQSVKAENYGAEVYTSGEAVNVSQLHSNEPTVSTNVKSRIIVKNGVPFTITLPSNSNPSGVNGATLSGTTIKVTEAGSVSFYHHKDGKECYVLVHVNYKGMLQFGGSDAPATLDVTLANQDDVLSVPAGKFPAMGWFGSGSEEIGSSESMSLKDLLLTNHTSFVVKFTDGTSNQLADGTPGALSSCAITLVDKRTPQSYDVTLSANPSTGGTVSGAGTYNENSQVTVTAQPTTGWRFVKWTEGGAQVSTSASYQFQLSGNRNLIAHFERIPPTPQPKKHQVTLSQTGQGTLILSVDGIAIQSGDLVEAGKVVKLTTSPAAGWEIKNLIVKTASGEELTIGNDSSFVMPNEAVAVSIKFGTVSNEIIPGFEAYASGEIVYLSLPARETIRIYSLSGVLVGVYPLSEGAHQLLPQQRGVLILEGSTGWSKKVIVR